MDRKPEQDRNGFHVLSCIIISVAVYVSVCSYLSAGCYLPIEKPSNLVMVIITLIIIIIVVIVIIMIHIAHKTMFMGQ